MTRYQVVKGRLTDTVTGEVLEAASNEARAARLAHRRALWALDDKRKGNGSPGGHRTQRKAATNGYEGWIILGGLLLLMLVWR